MANMDYPSGTLQQDSGEADAVAAAGYDPSMSVDKQNIADLLTEDQRSELGRRVIREFEIDERKFADRKERIEALYKLALQKPEAKDYPFTKASNIKFPLLTKAAVNFAVLTAPALFKDNRVVKSAIVGSDDGVETLTNADGSPIMDEKTGKPMKAGAGMKVEAGERVSVCMSHQLLNEMEDWESDMDKLLHIIPIIGCAFKKTAWDTQNGVPVVKLVLPQYLIINIDAGSIYNASRVSELVSLYPWEIKENINAGIFSEFEYGQSTESKDADLTSSDDTDLQHVFIEQHRRVDLDGDGYAEPYIVWVHKTSAKVCRILPRFSGSDIKRGEGNRILRIDEKCHYVDYPFLPDPQGSPYGIGFGHLSQHLNEAVNTSVNQLIDAGHRNIMGGGFLARGLKLKGGDLRFQPGEYKRVDASGMTIKDSVMPLPMPEPSPVLFAMMQWLVQAGEDVTALTKVMAGEIPANTPATTMLAAVEQGMQPFKAIFKRIHRSLKREFKLLFDLNYMYLSDEKYRIILDSQTAEVAKDFDPKAVDIVPVSDPDMVNNVQRLMRAQALMDFKDDQYVNQIELRQRIFSAMSVEKIDDLLITPTPNQPSPLEELQMKVAESQIAQIQAQESRADKEEERKDIRLALEIETAQADKAKKLASATKDIADAEATEQGVQIDQYEKEVLGLAGKTNDGNSK